MSLSPRNLFPNETSDDATATTVTQHVFDSLEVCSCRDGAAWRQAYTGGSNEDEDGATMERLFISARLSLHLAGSFR